MNRAKDCNIKTCVFKLSEFISEFLPGWPGSPGAPVAPGPPGPPEKDIIFFPFKLHDIENVLKVVTLLSFSISIISNN